MSATVKRLFKKLWKEVNIMSTNYELKKHDFDLSDYEPVCYECGVILNCHNMYDEDYCVECVQRIMSNGY